ncbi:hypothetical protein [Streptomyces sp. CdTB01]|uniref:WXG100-like domain-containing protein n=1 Tax=Streptomyces sp. CdTB01 TaxID=1725411 RepID=UPI00073AAA55|nr:hypothetical protein [Streptomyces sp. CdTB01]ALV31356.1 hypothetical protein AS200_04285 [Streptomyces sp. CdTB01]
MSVEMPPELAWVARLAVGQAWPKGNEDDLHALGQAWQDAALELKGISGQIGASGNGVLESVGGQVADEFRGFVTQLEASLPEMAESAGQLGKLGKHTAVQVEYAKYMILGQLILLAAQIAEWAFFAPEVIPVAITSARLAVKMILRRLLISVATGVALNVGLDVAVQTIQFLEGDRTQWSTENTVSAVVSGAIGGAMGGLFFGAGGVLAPRFAHSLLGKGILGAATGISTAGIMYGIYHSGQDEFGTSISAGALGALGGGGKRRFGGKGDTFKVDPVHVNVPDALTFGRSDLPAPVPAEKPESPSATGTFKESTQNTGTTEKNTTGEATAPAVAATHGTSTSVSEPVAAPRDPAQVRELPGFSTTVTTAHAAPSRGDAGTTAPMGRAATAQPRGTTGSGGTTGAAASATGARPSAAATGARRSTEISTGTRAATPGPAPAVRTETGVSTRDEPRTSAPTENAAETAPRPSAATRTQTGPDPVRTTQATTAGAVTETAPPAGTTGEQHTAAPPPQVSAATTPTARTADASAPPDGDGTAPPHRQTAATAPSPAPEPPTPLGGHRAAGREPAPRMTLDRTPRFVVRSGYEARRFVYQDERFTDLTIRVAFRDSGARHDVDAVWHRMADGVEEFLNAPRYRLPNGDRLHVTVVRARPGEEPHLTVDLVGRDRAMDQRSWWPDADPVDFAHEIGHQVGLRDEYRDRDTPHRPAVEGSLQGDYRAPAPEGLRQAGLRDRHLRLIGAGIGDLGEPAVAGRAADEAPSPDRPASDGAPPYDAQWERARAAAQGHERSHTWVDPVSDPQGAARGVQRSMPAVAPRMHQLLRPSVYSPDNMLVMQPGYASGDQFGILAMLLAEPNMHVLIARGPGPGEPGHDPILDKSRAIEAFYRESGIDEDRIWVLDLPKLEQGNVWPQLNDAATDIAQYRWGINKDFHEMYEKGELWGVSSGTDYVARLFSPAMRSALRDAWHLEGHDPEIVAWLGEKGVRIPEGDKGVLVLWSRFTGKATQWSHLRGRMEHDTSFEGTRQLIRNLAADYKAVIITGDPHPDGTKAGKWDELVQQMRAELGTEHIHNLTGFWRSPTPRLEAWGGDTRTGQFRLYDHLARLHSVQHLGFRSGNLEAVALIGHPVRYLEESDSTGSSRMSAWHAENKRPDSRRTLEPGYERIVVSAPPTASGRYAKQFEPKELQALYQPPDPNSWFRKPAEAYREEHGFGYEDVEQIREDLRLTGAHQEREAFDAARVRDVLRRYHKAVAEIRQYPDYPRHAQTDVDRFLAPLDAIAAMHPATYAGGATQMYADLVSGFLPRMPDVSSILRRVRYSVAWAHYAQQQAAVQASHQGVAPGGDEVMPRAPVADDLVTSSDGTAMVSRPTRSRPSDDVPSAPAAESSAQAAARAERSADHPAFSAVPTTDGFAELRHLSDTAVTETDASSRYGMPVANFRKFRQFAADRGLRIDVRPTNPTSVRWLEEGKLPKPKEIKAKSINDLDVALGARPEHRGLVGYFEPVLPERGDHDEAVWSRIQARYAQRAEEFRVLAPVMADLRERGLFKVEDGLVYGRDDRNNWTEITGDHDLFDISTPGGTRLKGERQDEVVGAMKANAMAVMHPPHMSWEPTSPFSKSIYNKIVESHQEGGEPLLRFRPDLLNAELVHAPREFLIKLPEPEPEPVPEQPEAKTVQPEPSAAPGLPLLTPPRIEYPVLHSPEPEGTIGARPVEPEVQPVAESQPVTGNAVRDAEPEPMVVEPDGEPATPDPPGDAPQPTEEPGDHAAPPPEPSGPPAQLRGRHLRSLAGIRITDAPGPEELRARLVGMLPAAHAGDRQVVQKLDVEFDPVAFRAGHEEMVNGGRRFQLRVNGVLHDVVLTARPAEWRLREEQAPDAEKTGKGFERSAEAKRETEPKKTSLTTSEAGLDLAPTVIRSDGGHPDRLAVINPSVKAGGATHATDTSVKEAAETGSKTSLTGPTDTYVSRFRYDVAVIGPDGRRRSGPAGEPLVGEVTAEVTRPGAGRPEGEPARWNGWESGRPGRPEGRPLDVTGLSGLHADVFRHLPSEQRPDGTAHRDILEFLSPKNVVDGFEHAAGSGLVSKRLDLSDGGHAWLRLTLEPGTSVHEGTVSGKDAFTSKETGEHGAGRTDTSGWGLGLNGGGARRVRQSTTTEESTWLTVTGGYTYARSEAHQEKGKQTFSVEHTLERAGTADLIRTQVRFRVEVLREHLSPRADGLHDVRPVPDPGSAPGGAPRDVENPSAPRTGEVIRVRPHPATPPVAEAQDGTPSAAGPGTRPAPGDLRAPLTAQRTAFVDVPGSTELERHITDRLREVAPGVLPPPDIASGRVTPQALESQRLLRARLSPSGLRADGGRLLDGTFRITLDASHLPGLPGRAYEVVVRADIGTGRHEGAAATTVKSTVARGHASEKGVTRGGKHTLGVSGNVRSALNPQDSVRAFGLAGVDGSYAPSRQTVAVGETQTKRTFQHKGPVDAFSYPVGYRVLVASHREGDPPSALPARSVADGGASGTVRDVVLAEGDRLHVEVRRPEVSASAPPYLRPGRLPQLHSVTHVGDEAGFRRQAVTALRNAYDSRRADSEPPRVPELDEAVDALTGRAQLPGLVSASQAGWVNTLDRHVGDGRDPDTVGLSVRTRLTDLTYEETLSGDGTLDLELKASAATTLGDQTSWSLKGNLGPDFGRFPETATGALTTSYQLRGGVKAKLGGQWDDTDTVKQQTTASRTAGHTGTWHVYRATAEVSVVGRITDATGAPHLGRALRRDHEILVLLSEEDAALLRAADAAVATARPPELRATLLDQNISGGVLVDLPDTDAVLREIHEQVRGPGDVAVPVAALPFADTFAPDALAARYDELVGPGILDRHVEVTRAGRVVTEVLVRGIPGTWTDQGVRSDRPLTREVSAADTVKGKSASKRSAGLEGSLRAAVRPPVAHLNSASLTPGAAFEGSRGDGAESGVTTTIGHKTSGFGGESALFATTLGYEVTVTRRTETGRFVHLPKTPATVGPARATAWVPASLTQSATAPPHPQVPNDPGRPAARPAPSANHPFDIELARTNAQARAERAAWQNELDAAHDLVGFDRGKALHDAAVETQATPLPWGDGLLGQIGASYSWALARGTGLARWAVRSALPEHLTATVTRFLDTFAADPRLGRAHDLSREQRLTVEEQFAIRQALSGQSPAALFHRLTGRERVIRIPGTSLALSMEAIGPAEEVARRDAADDELTVTVKDEADTSAADTANWNVSPLDFSVLTEDPVLNIPLNTGRMTRDQSYDVARPVTRAPGTPGRPTPDSALPHGRTATEPGKVKITELAFLMRQPVRITIRRHDDATGNGAPRFVTGHVFHWSTTPAAGPPSASASRPGPSQGRPTAPAAEPTAAPRPLRGPAPAPRSSGSQTDETAPRAPLTGATGATSASGTADGGHPATATLTHGVTFGAEDATRPGPEEIAAIDALAAELAHDAVRRTTLGRTPPQILISGHGTAAVAGRPHFGRAFQLGAERADGVRDVLARRLDAHLRDLGSPLTSDAFTITTESRGPDLPHGTDPAHDTPEARRRATITVVHRPDPDAVPTTPAAQRAHAVAQPPAADPRPPVRPEQWRARRDHAVWAVLRTERYDPARDPAADRPASGLLAGRDVVVRAAVARIQADDGRWVRNLSLHLPVRFGEGFTAADLGAYRERLQALLDTYVNDGRRLPGSGDQLHIDVELEHRPDHAEAVEISRSERPAAAWDQFTFPLGTHEGIRDDARALHEMLHYAGLPDRYHDTTTLFRRLERQSERTGLMADIDTIDVPDTYLRAIAEVTDSGPVLRDLPFTDGAKPPVTAPGPTGAEARETLLAADPEPHPAGPVRPPAAAPFAGRSQAYVDDLMREVRHPQTETDHGRNWAGSGRPPLDTTNYVVVDVDGRRTPYEVPWSDAYIVMARVRGDQITLETPGATTPDGKIRLTDAEDFAALLASDPRLPAGADIVLALLGRQSAVSGLPQAVSEATGRRVWAPSAGTLRIASQRIGSRKRERFELLDTDLRWAATTSAAHPDHFAHLRAEHLLTQEYTVTAGDGDAVLFHRLPATRYESFSDASRSDPDLPALTLPTQSLDVVPVGAFPDIRVSQDRTLAIDGDGLSQHAYATERAVDEANARLAAAGSKVRLTADPEVSLTFQREDGLPTPPLLRITPEFLTRSQRSEEEACRDFAQMVSGQVRASHVVFRVPGERVATAQISALDTAEVTGTHHLAESLAQVADGALDPARTGPAWAAAQTARDDRGVGGQGGSPLPGREYGSALGYGQVDDPRRYALTQAARRTGINEAAWAEVGEGYLVQSINAADDDGRPTLAFNHAKPTASNASHFGYHFATVVLASEDGQTQITLENHARVSRNRATMSRAVELNLESPAAGLRALATVLEDRARFAERVNADEGHQNALRARARLADRLAAAREARDRGAPVEEQERTFQQAATAMLRAAPMIDGKHQWYFRSYSRRPGESMHESHAELLSRDYSAEANPLTLVVLHGHGVSAPEHRFIPFEASGAMADSAGFKLGHLAEQLVRSGLWNLAHGLPLPAVRLTGHDGGSAPQPDLEFTAAMAETVRDALRLRLADVLREHGSDTDPDAFRVTVASGLRRHDGRGQAPEVTFEVDDWRDSRDDHEGARG